MIELLNCNGACPRLPAVFVDSLGGWALVTYKWFSFSEPGVRDSGSSGPAISVEVPEAQICTNLSK